GANSRSSATLTRSPVTAMWSGLAACRSWTSVSTTSERCATRRRRRQLMMPSTRLPVSSLSRGVGNGPRCGSDRCPRTNIATSGAADQDACEEHQRPPDHDLERRGQEWSIHEAPPDPRYCAKLNDDHDDGDRGGDLEFRYQIGQCV